MSRTLAFVLFFAAGFLTPTWGATKCSEHFVGGVAPAITNVKLQARTQEICFESYAVLHSGISRTPLYSAEHLTRADVEAAKTLSRHDSYHPENSLPAQDRAELSDYARSGYDRGHMSPNGDMPNRFAQAESFSLANMVPQVHANNAGVWAGIEGAARQLALDEGEVYVVSGPAFIGSNIQRIGNVLVPTHLWKVLYSPAQRRAGAYVITNDDTREYSAVTVSDLEEMIGVSLLPGLSRKVRDNGMELPMPTSRRGAKSRKSPAQEKFILNALKRASQL
ncbi:DNA/RNA non-specific endonuclease [Polaromonas sp.]|uniref:DNA/RNA non-specific endonuclease n=1 Tax=Polaromonas sp. TaxID=1869339 RepID=UPI0017EA6D1E|nr:DNA/RNA non-specific endonuclease [Polaromonas sp.]NMM07421.1 DNA/RNA non-specific endonuclease [Polaromonas sp.]